MNFSIDEKVLLFDPRIWNKHGGNIDSRDCYKEAIIYNIKNVINNDNPRHNNPLGYEYVFDLKFLHDGHHSFGNRAYMIKKLNEYELRQSELKLQLYNSLKELYGYMEDHCRGSNFEPMLWRAYQVLQKVIGEIPDPSKHNSHYRSGGFKIG